ncbi:helix-turn-helix transcriptional regulator [Cellulomonas cellasea]|uniref:helix-turn-helix domain-containing protein n=1 Tax=Cellulomonas cellasea TaxID=43670 RepID=UPI0025A314F5|nr:helix-turn-helix transcriptional regulator [Cellulomonas cellasea]MDM8085252.1 helix-turn-helix transcriptional regulator [Cellulomonas cellasea]
MDRDTEIIVRIAQRLRESRSALGLTQNELAERLGVTQAYLSRLETGEATLQVRRLVQALSAVGLDLIAIPRTNPAAKEERMRPLALSHRRGKSGIEELAAALTETDLSRIANSEIAALLRLLRTLTADPEGLAASSDQYRRLIRHLRRLASSDAAIEVADPQLRRVLLAIRAAFPAASDQEAATGSEGRQ